MRPNELAAQIPQKVQEVLLHFADRLFLAGGAVRDIVRGDTPRDYDLWLHATVDGPTVGAWLVGQGWGMRLMTPSHWVYTWNDLTIDLVKQSRGGPMETIQTFDFVMVQGALAPPITPGGSWSFYSMGGFTVDALNGEVLFAGSCLSPAATIRRLVEYAARGFEVSRTTIRDVLNYAGVGDPDDAIGFGFAGYSKDEKEEA